MSARTRLIGRVIIGVLLFTVVFLATRSLAGNSTDDRGQAAGQKNFTPCTGTGSSMCPKSMTCVDNKCVSSEELKNKLQNLSEQNKQVNRQINQQKAAQQKAIKKIK